MRVALRRLVNYPVTIGALLEIALFCAIPYVVIGAIVSISHGEEMRQMQVERGSDALVAWAASVVAWPVLLFSHSCAG